MTPVPVRVARLTHETHNALFCWRFTLEGVTLLCHGVAHSTMAGEFPEKPFSYLGVTRTEDFRRECCVNRSPQESRNLLCNSSVDDPSEALHLG